MSILQISKVSATRHGFSRWIRLTIISSFVWQKIMFAFSIAVREDRMPGGRNSGAVYNMYKVKYKKHKRGGSSKMSLSSPSTPMSLPPPQSPALSTPRMSPAMHQVRDLFKGSQRVFTNPDYFRCPHRPVLALTSIVSLRWLVFQDRAHPSPRHL